jgi:hypothetical protein
MTLDAYPAILPVALYAQFTCGVSMPALTLQLRDETGGVLGECEGQGVVAPTDRHVPCQLCWRGLTLQLPRPGHYELVLLAGDEEVARCDLEILASPQSGVWVVLPHDDSPRASVGMG